MIFRATFISNILIDDEKHDYDDDHDNDGGHRGKLAPDEVKGGGVGSIGGGRSTETK